MVLDVEYRQQDTTFTMVDQDVFAGHRDTSYMSCRTNSRDTSTSPRDSLEEMRQSHNSILNVTSDGEESDDDDSSQCSYLFADLNEPPRLDDDVAPDGIQPRPIVACCPNEAPRTNMITNWLDTSTNSIRNVTESFAESLCPGTALDEPCGSFDRYISRSEGDRSLLYQMELDIFALLGCSDHATDEELDAWTLPLLCPYSERKTPVTAIRSRIQRIHKFRKERHLKKPDLLKKNKSFDTSMLKETNAPTETSFQDAIGSIWGVDDDLLIGGGLEAIPRSELDGYDSDPGDCSFLREDEILQRKDVFEDPLDVSAVSHDVEHGFDTDDIVRVVQESLNRSWTLTWHPTKENISALGRSDTKKTCLEPKCVQLWFERGHILHGGKSMIEPQFMWRPCSMTHDIEIVMPYQMRLLNICRVLPVEEMDRSKYPLARTLHSCVVRMVSGDEFLFEASSEAERDFFVQRWKLVVARLATLAVVEDFISVQNEFFSTDPTTILA